MSGPDSPLSQRYEPWIGKGIKKYQIEALLGIGGMAVVFRAMHRNGNRVALKVLHAEQSLDADTRRRFLREGYVANKVAHRGAVRVLDDDVTEDGAAFLVMELLEGETLEARVVRCGGRLPVRDVASVGHQLLDVLSAAHDKGIIHRDIKPENVFVTNEGQIKVLDFGIARLREANDPSQTRTGRTFGTPAFMPPEQALGRKQDIDGRTDLWAVAATMFTLVSGRFVHEADTIEELVVFAATRRARSVASVADGIPTDLAGVIDRALAFEKVGRWPDARSMQGALEEAYSDAFGEPLAAALAVRIVAGASGPSSGSLNMPARPKVDLVLGAPPYASTAPLALHRGPKPTAAVGPSRATGFDASPIGRGEPSRRSRALARWLALGSAIALAGAALAFFASTKRASSVGGTDPAAAAPGAAQTASAVASESAAPLLETSGSAPSGSPVAVLASTRTPVSDAAAASPQSKPSASSVRRYPTKRPLPDSGRPPAPITESAAQEHDIFKP